ncbi:pyridoxamine 5'-phosphate oxidase family protein [Ruegeria sp. AU67]|uniref:pyridoxamine 5'-phosphate oxidase family protein n=1 Tax=Ruegeria sp. AU67 TaxID=2108530 RepID=UPI000D69726A|nr:pyridoxamine 5'-phosphate oxidase family protein [Ruegeria sp. AU67]
MTRAFTEISFTPSVLALQKQNGSAEAYSKFMAPEADRSDGVGPAEAEFVSGRDGFYQATVSDSGWPYVQFRGGPVGFLKVLDNQTIAYADFRGNRQYLSAGNLTDDGRISLILMDYPNRRRLKIWGRAKLVSSADDPELMAQLQDMNYRGRPERAVVITVEALDWNCPQHIPQRMTMEELEPQLEPLRAELLRLNLENEKLRSMLGQND